jgi:hypothetical protein
MAAIALKTPTAPAMQKVPLVKIGRPATNGPTAFAPLTAVPRGCVAVQVDSTNAPFIRAGEFCVIDPRDRELVHCGIYLLQWYEAGRVSLLAAEWAQIGQTWAWWLQAPGGGLTDGPYTADGLSKRIVGRVVGVLADEAGQHLRCLWGNGAISAHDQPVVATEELPEVYVSQADGRCMEPLYHTGDRLEFTQLERPRPGDAVAIWRRPEFHGPGLFQCLVKRLVTLPPRKLAPPTHDPAKPSPVFIVETINPPKRYVVKAEELLGVHKCNGVYTGPRRQPKRDEMRALAAAQRAARANG